jgi:hypothetical protein
MDFQNTAWRLKNKRKRKNNVPRGIYVADQISILMIISYLQREIYENYNCLWLGGVGI